MVSVDKPAAAIRTYRTYEIPFPVLSDPDLAMHKAFKVLNRLDPEMVNKLASFGLDVEGSSGRKHHTIAIPSLFVIDSKGVVRWAHAQPDHRTRPSIEQILGAIDKLEL